MKQLRAGQTAFFASDLHLSAATPRTLDAFESWLASVADQGSLIYLIGDLFEVWCGDDFSDSTTQRFAHACQSARACGAEIYLMHGNRDFLIGEVFAELCAMAARLHLHLTVEGLEEAWQLNHLPRDVPLSVQGYYYSRPLPPQTIVDYVARGRA